MAHIIRIISIPSLTQIHLPSQLISMSSHKHWGEIVKSKPFAQQIPFWELAGDNCSWVEVKQPLWEAAAQAMEQPAGGGVWAGLALKEHSCWLSLVWIVWIFPVETEQQIVFLASVAGVISGLILQPVQLSKLQAFVFPQNLMKLIWQKSSNFLIYHPSQSPWALYYASVICPSNNINVSMGLLSS